MFHFTDGIDRTSQWIDPEKFLPPKKNLLYMQFDSSLRSQGQLFGVIYYRFWQVGRIAMTLILSAIANITESFPTSSSLFSSNQNLVQARWSLHKLEIKSQCRKERLNENLRQVIILRFSLSSPRLLSEPFLVLIVGRTNFLTRTH